VFFSEHSVLTTDRRRPTTDLSFGKIQITISATDHPIHFMFGSTVVFRERRIEWRYFRFEISKITAAAILEKFQMAISPQPVVRFTFCFALKCTPFMLLSVV